MKLLDITPKTYTRERADEIAVTLAAADADWHYAAEPLLDVNGRRDATRSKFVVRVTDEGGDFVAFWNEGGTIDAPLLRPNVQYVDYHGDEGIKTLREWTLAGGLPAAREWARVHGESWVLKADGSGFRLRRNCNAQGYSRKTFADVRPVGLVTS